MPSLPADEAIATRRSVRAFLPQPVDRAIVEELLALASRSPSGSNIQPGRCASSPGRHVSG
jgi:nitroreductase